MSTADQMSFAAPIERITAALYDRLIASGMTEAAASERVRELSAQVMLRGDGAILTVNTESGPQTFRTDGPIEEVVAAFEIGTGGAAPVAQAAPNMVDAVLAQNHARANAPNALRPGRPA